MNTTSAYTPLESLLLCQSLATHGTDSKVFTWTSELLKSNTIIRECDNFDPGRLNSESLQELYLKLLREELQSEAQAEGRGDASPSKKRKIQSLSVQTIKDAIEYKGKLPQLVERLYGQYREQMIRSIREDERIYELLQREIAEIERGDWDERLLEEERSKDSKSESIPNGESTPAKAASESRGVPQTVGHTSSPSTTQSDIISSAVSQPNDGQPIHSQPSPSQIPSPRQEIRSEGLAINDVLNSQESSRKASPQGRNSSQGLPSTSQQRTPTQDRPHGPSPLQPVAQQRPGEIYTWEQYQAGPPPLQQSPYQNYPPYHPSQYPPYHGPQRGSFSGPHGIPPAQGHVPSSPLNTNPIVLPLPNIGSASGTPGRPLDALADIAEQQYRAPSASPSMHGTPSAPGFSQPYAGYPPPFRLDGRPQSGNGAPSQWNPQYPPHYIPHPNYNYPQPQPGQRPYIRPDLPQPEQRQYNSPYNPSHGPRPPPAEHFTPGTISSSTPRPLHLRNTGIHPQTPASTGSAQPSTGKATRWTQTPTASTPRVFKPLAQPAFEALEDVKSPVMTPKILPSVQKLNKKKEPSSGSKSLGQGSRGNKRTRAGSTASSVLAGSYRSQSVMSHADELSLDNEATNTRVKQESSTPRPAEEGGDITADETINRRHGILRDGISPRRAKKRKRQESPPFEPSGPPTHVLWTRNFPKISLSALERIGAHRHASTFAHPVKEREAPGYKNIILRPQDLKSIRSSINAGYKVGNSLNEQGQASLMLPISEDLIPPKGIVNNSQLEKELMHMFANAVMFNPDPSRGLGRGFEVAKSIEQTVGQENYEVDENGVVKDTRAMFADVEKIVGELRSAERRSEDGTVEPEDDEIDELAAEGDQIGSVAKRRRRA